MTLFNPQGWAKVQQRNVGKPTFYCECCGNPALFVASSSLGAISFAFCINCIYEQVEPRDICEYTYAKTHPDSIAEWMRENVHVFDGGKYRTWNDWIEWRNSDPATCMACKYHGCTKHGTLEPTEPLNELA